MSFNSQFHYNSRENIAKKLKRDKERGAFAYGKPADIITHEFGHLMLKGLPEQTIHKLEAYYQTNKNDLEQISRYAKTNFREMFAESFLQYRNTQASPRAREILKIAGIIE